MSTEHVYLIPGFFGFVNFGSLVYFSHVEEALESELHARGVDSHVRTAPVSPTGSIVERTVEVARFIADTAGGDDAPIHLIGHSTGGLDARLLVTPRVNLGLDLDVESLAKRVRTVTCLATPHRGTPLASLFTGLLGERLLKLLSVSTIALLREGGMPVGLMAKIGGILARFAIPGGKTEALLDQLFEELIGFVPVDQKNSIEEFFKDVATSTDLLPQLTPAGLDLFSASTVDRASVRYGSVVTRAPKPSLRHRLHMGFRPADQASYALFSWLYGKAQPDKSSKVPGLQKRQKAELIRSYRQLPDARDNDGVVPTWSQIYGHVVYAAIADHLDIIGHFDEREHVPPHRDWLHSDAQFNRTRFDALWFAVAEFLVPRPAS